MFRSIRWTLLFWYGLILVLVIAGFGGTLYFHLESSVRKVRDTRLREWAQAVARGYDERHGEHRRVFLPEPYARVLETTDPHGPYYVVWNVHGKVAAQSRPGLDVVFPEEFRLPEPPKRPSAPPHPPEEAHTSANEAEHPAPAHRPRSFPRHLWTKDRRPPVDDLLKTPLARDRGPWHEVIVRGFPGATVLVGQSGREEHQHLHDFLMTMLAASAGALALAMVGGWFLAEWTLAPISRISAAASNISATNLSQRIDVTRTENELGKLARILNVTFERLEASFLRQTQFTADASHELRTPLAVVMSHCELALRKERSPADYRSLFETSLKASRRMRAVVEGLLTLARADASAVNLELEPVSLDEVVEESVAMLRPLATPTNVSIDLDTEPILILGDRERLRELLTNLVTNAIRYNQAGGAVFVKLRAEANVALLTVADTGVGIPEKDCPHIFERFYRVDPVRSRELGGSGLGLAISKWIVEAHGGTISFTSQEGVGTSFTVCLPVAPRAEKTNTDDDWQNEREPNSPSEVGPSIEGTSLGQTESGSERSASLTNLNHPDVGRA